MSSTHGDLVFFWFCGYYLINITLYANINHKMGLKKMKNNMGFKEVLVYRNLSKDASRLLI
jgi:hypothetical protein